MEVNYPTRIVLDVPVADSYKELDTITIDSSWARAHGQATISTESPDLKIGTAARFALGASADLELCIFSCNDFNILNIDVDQRSPLPLLPTPIVSKNTTTINPLLAIALGVGGSFRLPDVQLSGTVADGNSYKAEGTDRDFINLAVDVDTWVSRAVGFSVPLSLDGSMAGIPLSYNILDYKDRIKYTQSQEFEFTPTGVRGTLQFPVPVEFTERNASGGAVVSGTSSQVTFQVGNSVDIVVPEGVPDFLNVTPSFSLENSFRHDSTMTLTRSLEREVGEVHARIPSVQVIPGIPAVTKEVCDPTGIFSEECHDVTITPEIPAVNSPNINLDIGPLERKTLAEFSVDNAFWSETWELGGFQPIAVGAIQINPQYTPVARIDGPTFGPGGQGQRVAFGGNRSSDRDNHPLNYFWDFGDGKFSSSSPNVVHVFEANRSHTLRLTVDDGHETNSVTHTIDIDTIAPTVFRVDSNPSTDDGVLSENEALRDLDVSELRVTFSEAVRDPPGHTGADDVTNPAGYLLVSGGNNGFIDSVPCTIAGAQCSMLDQQQLESDSETRLLPGQHGQSFTPSISGSLTRLSVYIIEDRGESVTLRIFDGGISGSPPFTSFIGPQLHQQGVTLFSGWNDITLGSPVPVVAGRQYSYQLDGLTAIDPFVSNNGNTYPRGRALGLPAHDHLFKTFVAPPLSSSPYAFLGDDLSVAVDSVSYDAATRTATLLVNGGTRLPIGRYRLLARGRAIRDIPGNSLDGNGDGLPDDDFIRNFSITTAPPRVARINSLAETTDAEITEYEGTPLSITELLVAFNEPVQDPPGNSGPDDVTSPANYSLVGAGANGLFDSLRCDILVPDCIVLHNQQTSSNGDIGLIDGQFGQTFTAGIDGDLTGISFKINSVVPLSGLRPEGTLQVFSGGVAGTPPFQRPTSSLPLHEQRVVLLPGWNDITLSSPVLLFKGQEYTFRLVDIGQISSPILNLGNQGRAFFSACCHHLFKTFVVPVASTPPFAFLGDDNLVPIDGVTYDDDALTARLRLNGGNPLGGDKYRLYVAGGNSIKDLPGARLDGNGNGIEGGDFLRNFTVVNVPPVVANVDTVGTSGGGTVDDGESFEANVTQLRVTFSEPVLDPQGDTGTHDVTNPANYTLIGAGPNGVMQAVPCDSLVPTCFSRPS